MKNKFVFDTITPSLLALMGGINSFSNVALGKVGDELLRLSNELVPMDTGHLANTGRVDKGNKKVVVGYYTPYATRLHEHPEYNFRKDRNPQAQGKWLEEPLKKNLSKWEKMIGSNLSANIKSGSGFNIL